MSRLIFPFRFSLLLICAAALVGCGNCGGGNNGVDESCATRADCADGQRCNADGECTTESASCDFASDCGVDEYCAEGTCELANCEDDDDCSAGALCERADDEAEGTCRAGCREDSDCTDGKTCTPTNVCAQEGCSTNSCPSFQSCDESQSPAECVYTGDCESDVQCVAYANQIGDGEEYICSTAEQKCVVKPPCGDDSDCRIGDICEPRQEDGRQVCRRGCRDNDGCRPGQICDLDRLACTEGCDTVDDCPNDGNTYACDNLVCVQVCDTRNDCLSGQVCKGSPRTCQACTQNADCPATEFCDFTQGTSDDDATNPLLGLCVELPPTCPEDAYGSNHDQNTPYVIPALPFLAEGATAPLFCRENQGGDWFEFTAASGDVIEIQLGYDNTQGNLDVGLRREQGEELVASAQAPSVDGGTETIRFGVDLGGTFLVQVRGTITSANTNYDLSVDVAPPPACTADPLEPNNTEATAAALTAMQDYLDLEVCGSDADFYKLSVAENQIVRVTAEAPVNLGNIDIILRDPQGVQVAAAQTRQDVEEIEVPVEDAGDYILEVRVVSGVGNIEYDLMWSQRDNNCADPYEVNDVCPGATLQDGQFPNLNVCTDSDWYRVDLLPLQTLTLTATYDRSVSAGDLDVTLHGPNDCATLVSDGTETTVGNTTQVIETIQYQAPQGGTFHLQVFLFSGIQAEYDLEIDVSDGPPCQDDAQEPNDTSATATTISRSGAAAGTDNVLTGLKMCDMDEDWYAITLQASDVIRFDVQFDHDLGDLDAELIGPGNVAVDLSDSTTDNESVTYTVGAAEAGTYFLKVNPKVAARNDYWVLTYLNGTGPVDPVCPDDFENNDTRAEAASVGAGSYGLLVCGSPADPDWFSTQLTSGQTIDIDLGFSHSTGNIDLFLYDDSGAATTIAESRTATDGESVSYTTARDQTVFWRVDALSAIAAQPYDMDVAISAPAACLDDVYAGNISAATAHATTAPGLLPRMRLCSGKEDWYAVQLTAGSDSEAFINFDGSRADLDLYVYAASDLNNAIASGTSTTSDESATFIPATTGTYYVRVVGKANARLTYDLMLYTDTDGDGTVEGPEDRVCPDVFENNDSAQGAAQVPAGTYDDLLICSGDPDYYRIFVPAGATLTATANFDNSLGNIDLRILNEANQELVSSRLTDSNTETVSYENTGQGVNFLVNTFAAGASFSNYYQLQIALAFADACSDDAIGGTTKATAGTVTADAYELTLCEGEEDWFNLGSISSVDARLEFKNQLGDIDVELHDANGVVLAESGTTNTEELVATGLSGQHWLRVFSKNGAFVRNNYDLWLALDGTNPSAPYCPDEFERNDDVESANSINPSTRPTYPALNACGADQDWFITNDLQTLAYELAVFYDHSAGSDVAVRIWSVNDDPSVDAPLFEIDTAADDALGSWTPPAFGKYLVLIENTAAAPASTPYEFFMGLPSNYTTSGCREDALEPNESIVAARPITFPLDAAFGACGDDDYFKFTAPASGSITITTLFDASQLNLGLQVFDRTAGAMSVGFADADMGNRESVTFTAVAGHEYAIGVFRGFVGAVQKDGPYFLRVE